MFLSREDLLRAGFHEDCHPAPTSYSQITLRLFKRSDFFRIHVEEWDWSEFRNQLGSDFPTKTYTFKVQFRLESGLNVDVSPLFPHTVTPEEVEGFFIRFYLFHRPDLKETFSEFGMTFEKE